MFDVNNNVFCILSRAEAPIKQDGGAVMHSQGRSQ